ncbi:MAG: phospho-N-acetylmuramoyl-pentapeptide-transferase, partial [Alphaproteobacteria bacterium]|nr:phospho-N-acetylmuramoyl-pentapeptide-transferase [Alphaproteobacteria bacterium]
MFYFLALLTGQSTALRLFKYLTFRSGGAVITALLVAFVIGPPLISWLKIRQGKGQPIRSDGPQRHVVEKQGTPTMGGLLILVPTVVATLLWADLTDGYVWVILFVTFSYGLLGFLDDFYKVSRRTSDGLSGRVRLGLEFGAGFLATYAIMRMEPPALSGMLAIPFLKTALVPFGIFFIVLGGFVISGAANAVNFTDGLDGLAIVPVMIAASTFVLISYLVGNSKFADYL